METYRRADPTTNKQHAVPVAMPNHVFLSSRRTFDRRTKAVGELTLIAFFFLLRVGKYTYHGQKQRRTQQFRLQDMKFFAAGKEIAHGKLQNQSIDTVSLTIDNQKNGRRGDTLSHHALANNPCCPVHAVVARAIDMVEDGAVPDTLICSFREATTLPWQHVRSNDILQAVKHAIPALKLEDNGYDADLVGTHSLRSGGATALFINKHDVLTIQRAGRWTGSTFMEYIHGQLDVTTRGLAQSMSTQTRYTNMAPTRR